MSPRWIVSIALLFLAASTSAAGKRILLVARDLVHQPVDGLRFSYNEVKSRPTNRAGATELDLPSEQQIGQQIKVVLASPARRGSDWFVVNPQLNIPSEGGSAEVVVMRRSEFRRFAAAARETAKVETLRSSTLPTDNQRASMIEVAARYGLSAEQLQSAIRSFAETQDPRDRGIAAYLEGRYANAEELLAESVAKQQSDLVETLLYLGATQNARGEYRAAVTTFRKALALHPDDPSLLGWLGRSFYELADLDAAEPLMRRALTSTGLHTVPMTGVWRWI